MAAWAVGTEKSWRRQCRAQSPLCAPLRGTGQGSGGGLFWLRVEESVDAHISKAQALVLQGHEKVRGQVGVRGAIPADGGVRSLCP